MNPNARRRFKTETKWDRLERLRSDALDLLLEESGHASNVEQVLYWIVSTLNRLLNEEAS